MSGRSSVHWLSLLLQSFFRSDRHSPRIALPSRRGPKRELEPCSLAADPGPTKTAVVSRPFPVGARSVPLSYVRSSLLIHREQHHAGSGYVEILAIFWLAKESCFRQVILCAPFETQGGFAPQKVCVRCAWGAFEDASRYYLHGPLPRQPLR